MNPPYDNLFSFFRGPSHQDRANELGRQLEDNATKSLLNVLDLTDREEIAKRTVSTIGKSVGLNDNFLQSVPTSEWVFRTQVVPRDVPTEDCEIYLYGLSKEGKNPLLSEFPLDGDLNKEDSQDRLDSVIQIGSKITIIGEHKFLHSELSASQLRKYSKLFNIPEDQFGTLRWKSIYDSMADPATECQDSFSKNLAQQYREFLEYWQLSFQVSTSNFSYGENEIRILHGARLNRKTKHIQEHPAPIAIQFQTLHTETKNGPRVIFSADEWKALVEDLDDEFIDAFIKGNFDPLFDLFEDDGSPEKIELASIGQESGPRKALRAEQKGAGVLSFQTWDENNNHLRGERPMLAEEEFRISFGHVPNPETKRKTKLTEDDRITLFRDGDIRVLVEE